ncbi:hypothetical protein [Haloarcula sp. Atlit-7R]|uniref:hypothetical protein n=1 Tax=Haloarcula sp. Atlit-7R TaxID=2282125 RepID=UPI000EF135E8|nr:hypothetical protein [Haloarcula sp. Atlit-7R]RLM94349.1 hypothetical protein D3D01_15925 [Haloarcula sp. Atlit-7R]
MSQSKSQSTLSGDTAQIEKESDEGADQDGQQASLVDGIESGESSQDGVDGGENRANSKKGSQDTSDSEESLEGFGVEDDPRPNNSKLDNPDGEMEADRRVNRRSDDNNEDTGAQKQLFPDVEDDQATLTGERAHNQCLFE